MVKINVLFFIGLFLSTTLCAQYRSHLSAVEVNGQDISYKTYEKKIKTILGSTYFYEDWRVGDIELKNGDIIEGYPLKYDLKEQAINLRLKDKDVIKVIKGEELARFQWTNTMGLTEYFIACNTIEGFEEEKGFFELIGSDEEMAILSKNRVEFIKSNFNEVLLVGTKEDKFVKKVDFFILKNDKLMPIKTKRKNILQLTGIHSPEIKDYIYKKNLKHNDKEDLKLIFKHYFYLKGQN